jgi:hypothetical protein
MSIFHDGVLVDVHVRYWSGAKLLTAEDLGLTEEEVSEAFKLGKKDLIPNEVMKQFRTLESKARYAVDSNSFEFPIGHANFLPKKAAEKVFAELETCRAEYNRLTEDLIANYPKYKEQMRPVYQEAAEKAFLNQAPTGVQEFSLESRETEKEQFIQNYIARIESHYPAPESFRSRFELAWDVYTISLDAEKTTSSNLLNRIANDANRTLADLTTQATVAAQRKLEIEDYKAQTHERIGGFVDDVVKVLREQTVNLCNSVASNIQNGQIVTGRTYNRLSDFIEKFRDMNFVGDSVVEEQLNTLKKEFLDVFPTDQVREDIELKDELQKRLVAISKRVTDLSDVSEITGQYIRRVAFKRNGESDATSTSDN